MNTKPTQTEVDLFTQITSIPQSMMNLPVSNWYTKHQKLKSYTSKGEVQNPCKNEL